jgi:hypothetical protein
VSKWVENIRVNAGGRFLTRPNAIATETFLGGVTSMIEIRGAGPMSESIQPVQGFSVGNDVKELLALEVKAFEDASGWNAVSRGQVTGESGRAIIASREQLERIFAPGIQAQAMGFTEWAKIAMAGMKWGYDVPRQLGAVDNEAIHQDVLEREILLQDDLAPEVIMAADERWKALANQAGQKSGAMQPPQGGPAPQGGPSGPLSLAPQLPMSSNNPPFGAAPAILDAQMDGQAGMADALSRQA